MTRRCAPQMVCMDIADEGRNLKDDAVYEEPE